MPGDQSIGGAAQATPTRTALARPAPTVRFGWLLIAVLLASIASSAAAQQFKVDAADDKALRNSGTVLGCARGTLNYATERAKVEEYFTKGLFPDMTRYDPTALGQLGDKRSKKLFLILWGTSNQQMQSDITQWSFDAMKRVVAPGYHPAVRYNAILTIGLLDQEYGIDAGANRRPPKPLPQANSLLVQIVNAGAAGNKAVSPVLLAGALVGLERHARFHEGLPRGTTEAMTAAALKIVAQDKPTMEMDRDVHAWMRLKAAGVLAQLGSVGPNNQVHDALLKLIAESRTLDDRCAAAALLAKIKYDGAKIDGSVATEKMLALARDVAEAEAKRAEEFRDLRFTGGGGVGTSIERDSYRGRGEDGGGFAGEPRDAYPHARHVLTRLSELKGGFTALKPAVPADAQKKFDAVIAAIDPAIDATANKDMVSLNVAGAIVSMARAITAITGASAAAAPAEDAGFDAPVPAPAGARPAAPAESAPAEAPPAAAAATAPGAAQ